MRKIFLSLFVLLFFVSNPYCESFNEYRFKNASNFKIYSDSIESDFEEYQKELKKAFDDYKAKIAGVWGENNVIITGQKTYAGYFDKLNERKIIDFENGIVKLEFIMPQGSLDSKEIEDKIINSIVNALSLKPDNRSIIEISKNPNSIEDFKSEPILKDQIRDKKGNIVTSQNALSFASEILKQKKFESTAIKSSENSQKNLLSIDFPLADDHMKKRALKYVDIVIPESKKRNLEYELIFALIETESCFNPYAKSPIPAFGLMQLVPITAGRDAYRLVFKQDKAPTDKFLYDPKNNIMLGSAYLYILFNRYLDEIENIDSRKWCVIAAYNTGIGNVFEVFAGRYSKNKYPTRQIWKLTAFEKINQMTSEEVYGYLKENLQYKETRLYIEKVRSRIPKYKAE